MSFFFQNSISVSLDTLSLPVSKELIWSFKKLIINYLKRIKQNFVPENSFHFSKFENYIKLLSFIIRSTDTVLCLTLKFTSWIYNKLATLDTALKQNIDEHKIWNKGRQLALPEFWNFIGKKYLSIWWFLKI